MSQPSRGTLGQSEPAAPGTRGLCATCDAAQKWGPESPVTSAVSLTGAPSSLGNEMVEPGAPKGCCQLHHWVPCYNGRCGAHIILPCGAYRRWQLHAEGYREPPTKHPVQEVQLLIRSALVPLRDHHSTVRWLWRLSAEDTSSCSVCVSLCCMG